MEQLNVLKIYLCVCILLMYEYMYALLHECIHQLHVHIAYIGSNKAQTIYVPVQHA